MLDERRKSGVSRPALPGRPTGSRVCKLCEIEDFEDLELRELMREAFATEVVRFGSTFPTGVSGAGTGRSRCRCVRCVNSGSCGQTLSLGVGAAQRRRASRPTTTSGACSRPTLHRQRGVGDADASGYVTRPGTVASCEFDPRRLVVQHMNALELRLRGRSSMAFSRSGSTSDFGDLAAVRRASRKCTVC